MTMKKFLIVLLNLIIINTVYAHEEVSGILTATITKSAISGDVAVYNLSNGKLHTSDCEWAEKCTKNCIYIDKKELDKLFFVPCIVCGGGVIEPAQKD